MFIINKQNSQLLLTDSIRFIAVVKFCVALKFYKRITEKKLLTLYSLFS